MKRIGLLLAISLMASQFAYADDSEKVKQLEAENAQLKNKNAQLENKLEGTSDSGRNWWGGVSIRNWQSSFSAGSASTNMSSSPYTLALGYKKAFISITPDTNTSNDPSYPGGTLNRSENAFGVGYYLTQNFGIVLGGKWVNNSYPNSSSGIEGNTTFYTLALLGNWSIPNSKFIVFGNYSNGQGSSSCNCGSGVIDIGGTNYYSGYEIGVSYPFTDAIKGSVGYKSESSDETTAAKTTHTIYNTSTSRSGLFVGIGYSF